MRKALALIVTLGVLTVAGVFVAYRQLGRPNGKPDGRPVDVSIKSGTSGSAIAAALEQKGVIRSALAFRVYIRTADVTAGLKAGKYELRTDMPFAEVVGKLRRGPEVEFVRLVLPEGFTVDQTAKQVEKMTHISAAEFLAAATPASLTSPGILPAGVNSLEGLLYPSTYFVEEKQDAKGLVNRLVEENARYMRRLDVEKGAAKLGLTPYQIVVIASMIEEEAKADNERTKISAVIHNRLRQKIPLGIDATIQFAVKKYEGQPLTVSDLAINSPYNTRINAGLPPGPIASPRAGSIEAAMNPASGDILYYVLTSDCIHHKFTADYAEFNRAKAAQPRNC